MATSHISLIIPALNEGEVIGQTVRELPWDLLVECIVVDNGSTDTTAEEARQAGARVVSEPRRGYGRACWAGASASDPASGVLAFMDGDGSDVADDLRLLAEPVLKGTADFAIGSRIRGQCENGALLPSQIFAGWLAGTLIRLRYGVHYTDMGPMRVISRRAFAMLRMSEMTYGWNVEMQMRAAQLKLRIVELPTGCRRRRGGESKVSGSVSASIKAAVKILGVLGRVSGNG
ncbi:MAG TPA: glycosyltransferase family 2 protein [Acidobacteriaceae bacterium]|nr:glycosyltransferase family 2 protein [Acidobacteriaceae bacterium]